MNWLRRFFLRAQLRHCHREIEELERFRARAGDHLDGLLRRERVIRGALWDAENPQFRALRRA